jgi:hypothetical protein
METPIDRRRDDPENLKVVLDMLTIKKRRINCYYYFASNILKDKVVCNKNRNIWLHILLE